MGRDWTQKKLAIELTASGCPTKESWVANVEAGRIKSLTANQIFYLSKILKKPLDYFGGKKEYQEFNDRLLLILSPIMKKKIDEGAEKRMITPETYISIILSEYFTREEK